MGFLEHDQVGQSRYAVFARGAVGIRVPQKRLDEERLVGGRDIELDDRVVSQEFRHGQRAVREHDSAHLAEAQRIEGSDGRTEPAALTLILRSVLGQPGTHVREGRALPCGSLVDTHTVVQGVDGELQYVGHTLAQVVGILDQVDQVLEVRGGRRPGRRDERVETQR